ncbi:hypothetical protein C8R44DRAFT_981618, partial [Mycena epipterygia]
HRSVYCNPHAAPRLPLHPGRARPLRAHPARRGDPGLASAVYRCAPSRSFPSSLPNTPAFFFPSSLRPSCAPPPSAPPSTPFRVPVFSHPFPYSRTLHSAAPIRAHPCPLPPRPPPPVSLLVL